MKWLFRSAPVVAFLGILIWAYMALCGRTIRWRVEGVEHLKACWDKPDGFIVAAWHSTILTLPTAWTRYALRWPARRAASAMLISLSADGEPVARAIKHLGLASIRGSSTHKRKRRDKGGRAAIAEALRLLKAGGIVCITPDGPRGPRQRSGPGPVLIAKRASVAIVPYALATAPSRRLSTWDKFQLPIPFARGAIVFASPIKGADVTESNQVRIALETSLNAATLRAETLCDAPHVEPAEPTAPDMQPADLT